VKWRGGDNGGDKDVIETFIQQNMRSEEEIQLKAAEDMRKDLDKAR
jgi:hypothetical protein